jgi:hypothetical protein
VKSPGKSLEAVFAGKGRFHLAFGIYLEMEFQTIAVFSSAGDTAAVQGCLGPGEISAHRFQGYRGSQEFRHL